MTTPLQDSLSVVIEEALEDYLDRVGDLTISHSGVALVAAEAVEYYLIDHGVVS